MSLYKAWQNATITVASDNDLSAAVDLGIPCEYLDIIVPTITSADISVYVAETADGTYQHLGLASNVFAAGTGAISTTFNLGGWQHVKIGTSAAQLANTTFRVRGWRL